MNVYLKFTILYNYQREFNERFKSFVKWESDLWFYVCILLLFSSFYNM